MSGVDPVADFDQPVRVRRHARASRGATRRVNAVAMGPGHRTLVSGSEVADDRPMTTSRQAWDQLGSKLESLGLKLKLHYEQEADAETGDDTGVRRSLERIGEAIEDAFEALGNAVDDDAVRNDAKDSAALLVDALNATFTEVGDELRNAVRRRR
jgi:hypothetical protein